MTKLFYGENILQVIDGNKEAAPHVVISLDAESPSKEDVLVTQRLLILGAIGAILASDTLEELYVPIQLDEMQNVVLNEQWETIKKDRIVRTVKFRDENDNSGYGKLTSELLRYRRAGLLIMKTEAGAVAEVVEIEKL